MHEGLLEGLIRVLEERLGRIGRPLTTIVVICLALEFSSWGLKLFWDNAASPIANFIQTTIEVQPITLEEFVKKVVTPLGVYLLLLVIMYVIAQLIFRKKIFQPTNEHVEKAREIIKEAEDAKNEASETIQKAEEVRINMKQELEQLKSLCQELKSKYKKGDDDKWEQCSYEGTSEEKTGQENSGESN